MAERFKVGISPEVFDSKGAPIYGPNARALLAQTDVDWEFIGREPTISPSTVAAYDALVLMGERIAPSSFDNLGGRVRLKHIGRIGVGYDTIDVPSCDAQGVALTIVPDGVRRPVAAATMAMMLALTTKMWTKDRIVREARWGEKKDFMGVGVVGRTLGIVGLGNIGAEVARLARPFDMKLLASDPNVDPAKAAALGVELVPLAELMGRSDVVTVHCLLDEKTRGLIGAAEFALMKPDAYFINFARGPVVQEKALIAALREGRIAGAGIDVFEQEPTPIDNPLLAMDNVILAPHALCWTDQCMDALISGALGAAYDVKHGRKPKTLVNPQALAHPRLAHVAR